MHRGYGFQRNDSAALQRRQYFGKIRHAEPALPAGHAETPEVGESSARRFAAAGRSATRDSHRPRVRHVAGAET